MVYSLAKLINFNLKKRRHHSTVQEKMKKFLPTLNTLKVGDRIVVPKSSLDFVQHHAIFMGTRNNQYVFIENKESIGVRLVTAELLFVGVDRITRIQRFSPRAEYSRQDLYDYALTKIGRTYNLINYNCEHLANEIQHRIIKSKQSDTGVGLALFGLLLLVLGGIAGGGKK